MKHLERLEHLESLREFARDQERFLSLRDGAHSSGLTAEQLENELRSATRRRGRTMPQGPRLASLLSRLLPGHRS
jgi:hypothetical protein